MVAAISTIAIFTFQTGVSVERKRDVVQIVMWDTEIYLLLVLQLREMLHASDATDI